MLAVAQPPLLIQTQSEELVEAQETKCPQPDTTVREVSVKFRWYTTWSTKAAQIFFICPFMKVCFVFQFNALHACVNLMTRFVYHQELCPKCTHLRLLDRYMYSFEVVRPVYVLI